MVQRDGRTAFSGAVAGVISGILLQPLEVLKINLILMPKQFDYTQKQNFLRAFVEASKIIYREEGLRGFYRGNVPSVLSSGISAGLYFSILGRLEGMTRKRKINKQISDFFCSAIARSMASCLVNPLNVWKTRAEILGYNEYRSIRSSITKIYTNEGFYGFFKGTLLMMLRDFPFGGIFYLTYKATNHVLHQFSQSHMVYLLSGIFSGVVATTCTHPVEIILAKTQADTSAQGLHGHKSGILLREITSIYKSEGFLALFKGLFPRLIRKPLTNALTFFFFEVLTRQKRSEIQPNVGEIEDSEEDEYNKDSQSVY